MGARQPPKREQPSRIIVKMLVLVLLLFGAGVVIWNETTTDRIPLIEDRFVDELGLDPSVLVTVNGKTLYVAERTAGRGPVVLLHDVDVSGSVTFDSLVDALDNGIGVYTIDLPGFGLSTRTTEPGTAHTVAQMGRDIAAVIEERFGGPVVLAGVGLGGEVAAEVAATHQELVSGLVLVDVDFWREEGWRERSQRLWLVGHAMTFRYETSGGSARSTWAPYCGDGGWCPTTDQAQRRSITASIAGSTDSINAFWRTPRASFVPNDLNLITAPTIYVWSTKGRVPRTSVDEIGDAIGQMTVEEVEVFQAHLEAADRVAAAIARVTR